MALDAYGCPLTTTIKSLSAVVKGESSTAAVINRQEQSSAKKKRKQDASITCHNQGQEKISRRTGTTNKKMSLNQRDDFVYPSYAPFPAAPGDDRLAELVRVAEAHLSTTHDKRQDNSKSHHVPENTLPLDWSSYFGVNLDSQAAASSSSSSSVKRATSEMQQDICSAVSHCDDCHTAVSTCPAVDIVTEDQCCAVPCAVSAAEASQAPSSCKTAATICCEEPHHLLEETSGILACVDEQCSDAAKDVCNHLECAATELGAANASSFSCLTACDGNKLPCTTTSTSHASNIVDSTATCHACEGSPSSRRYTSFQELLDCWCCSDSELKSPCESSLEETTCVSVVDDCKTCCIDDAFTSQSGQETTPSRSRSSTTSMSFSSFHSPHPATNHQIFEPSSTIWQNPASIPMTSEQFSNQNHLNCINEEDHGHNAAGVCFPPGMTLYTTSQKDHSLCSTSTQAHTCRWAGCGLQCASVADLANHVNNVHLSASSNVDQIQSSTKVNETAQLMPTWSQDHAFKCLWDSCQSQEIGHDTAWNDGHVILQHVLQAHVGVDHHHHHNSPASSTGTNRKRKSESILGGKDDGESETTWSSSILATECGCETTAEGEHPCDWKDCCLTFPNHEALTNHITEEHIGSGKSEYTCQWKECSRGTRTFQQKQKIIRHLQTHTGHRPFVCDVCQKRFSEANTLAQHKRTHTKEKPYKCEFPGCNKSFAIAGSLTIHKRVHTGEKPFNCTWNGCNRAFAESSNLTKHMRVHTGERPFRCTQIGCNKSFSRPDQLTRHRKTHEKG